MDLKEDIMTINIGAGRKRKKVKGRHHCVISANLRVDIKREDSCYISYCPDLELSSFGETPEKALKNLGEVIEIFFEDIIQRDTLEEVLAECGWKRIPSKAVPQWVPPAHITEQYIPLSIEV